MVLVERVLTGVGPFDLSSLIKVGHLMEGFGRTIVLLRTHPKNVVGAYLDPLVDDRFGTINRNILSMFLLMRLLLPFERVVEDLSILPIALNNLAFRKLDRPESVPTIFLKFPFIDLASAPFVHTMPMLLIVHVLASIPFIRLPMTPVTLPMTQSFPKLSLVRITVTPFIMTLTMWLPIHILAFEVVAVSKFFYAIAMLETILKLPLISIPSNIKIVR
jgi:hypothetical protein